MRIPSLLMQARALATVRVWKKLPEHQAHSRFDIRGGCGLPVATRARIIILELLAALRMKLNFASIPCEVGRGFFRMSRSAFVQVLQFRSGCGLSRLGSRWQAHRQCIRRGFSGKSGRRGSL